MKMEGYNKAQKAAITAALKTAPNILDYINPSFTLSEIFQVRLGIENNLDVAAMLKQSNSTDMKLFRLNQF